MIKLDYLPVCYTQCSILTVLYVVCYQSVTRNSNISGYVYNRELLTKPTPISHLLNMTFFFYQTHVSGGVIKHILVSIISVTFNMPAQFHF